MPRIARLHARGPTRASPALPRSLCSPLLRCREYVSDFCAIARASKGLSAATVGLRLIFFFYRDKLINAVLRSVFAWTNDFPSFFSDAALDLKMLLLHRK